MSDLASGLLGVALPPGLAWHWRAYHAALMCSFAFQAVNVAALLLWVGIAVRRRLQLQPREVCEPVTVVVPAYLPNEAQIIGGTIVHILTKIEHIEKLDLYVVYNTPHDMPAAEAEVCAWERAPLPPGRRVFVQRAPGSRSKAANLNHVLPQVSTQYVAIYDADHHPDPDSLALAIKYLDDNSGVDCVSGSTYIRQGPSVLKWFIHADFFNFFFVQFPIFQRVAGTGFFTGSNGVWRASSFDQLFFDTKVLTEDVDISIRGILHHGLQIDFLPECRSGELTPTGLAALWKQRLRWTMGWDQATLKYAPMFWQAAVPLRRRIGMYYIFVGRWFARYSASAVALANAWQLLCRLAAGACGGGTPAAPGGVADLQRAYGLLVAATVCCGLVQALMHEPRLGMLAGLCAYYALLPLYSVAFSVLMTVSLCRVATGNLGAWVVTARPVETCSCPDPEGADAPAAGGRGSSACLLHRLSSGALQGAEVKACGPAEAAVAA